MEVLSSSPNQVSGTVRLHYAPLPTSPLAARCSNAKTTTTALPKNATPSFDSDIEVLPSRCVSYFNGVTSMYVYVGYLYAIYSYASYSYVSYSYVSYSYVSYLYVSYLYMVIRTLVIRTLGTHMLSIRMLATRMLATHTLSNHALPFT